MMNAGGPFVLINIVVIPGPPILEISPSLSSVLIMPNMEGEPETIMYFVYYLPEFAPYLFFMFLFSPFV